MILRSCNQGWKKAWWKISGESPERKECIYRPDDYRQDPTRDFPSGLLKTFLDPLPRVDCGGKKKAADIKPAARVELYRLRGRLRPSPQHRQPTQYQQRKRSGFGNGKDISRTPPTILQVRSDNGIISIDAHRYAEMIPPNNV